NNTPYGLSAGIWSDKGSRILGVADKLRAGVVWANTFNRFDPSSPFGGYKESGYGREGGRHGLGAYLAPGNALAKGSRRSPQVVEGSRSKPQVVEGSRSGRLETTAPKKSPKPTKRGSKK